MYEMYRFRCHFKIFIFFSTRPVFDSEYSRDVFSSGKTILSLRIKYFEFFIPYLERRGVFA